MQSPVRRKRTLRILLMLAMTSLWVSLAQAKIIKTFRLQIGSLSDAQSAEVLRQRASQRVPLPVFVDPLFGQYKVTVGDFSTYQEASNYKDRVYAEGFRDAFIVEVLSSVSDQKAGPVVYKVQVGNFGALLNARELQDELQQRGVSAVTIDRIEGFYKVRVGPYRTRQEATDAMRILKQAGYVDAWVVETRQTDALFERRILAMSPAKPASMTPSAPELSPETLAGDTRYQVILGPFTQASLADRSVTDLQREGYPNARVVPSEGMFLVEVDAPKNLLQADNTRKALREKGFLNVGLREQKVQVAAGAPQPSGQPGAAPAIPEEVQRRLKELEAELERLKQAPAAESPKKMAEAYAKAAGHLFSQGHYAAARDQYQLALQNDPTNQEAIDGLAASLNALREQEATREDTTATLLAAARELMQAGEYRAARMQYRMILDRVPGNTEALEGMARAEERLKTPQVAAAAPLAATPTSPVAPLAPASQVGQLLSQSQEAIAQGQLGRARNLLQQAQQLEPQNPQVQSELQRVNQLLAEQRRAAAAAPAPAPEPGKTSWWSVLLWMFVFLIVLGAGGAGAYYFLILRKKSPKAPKAPVAPKPAFSGVVKPKILGLEPKTKPATPPEKKEGRKEKEKTETPPAEPVVSVTGVEDTLPEFEPITVTESEQMDVSEQPITAEAEQEQETSASEEYDLDVIPAYRPSPFFDKEISSSEQVSQEEPGTAEPEEEPEEMARPEAEVPVAASQPSSGPVRLAGSQVPSPQGEEIVFSQTYNEYQVGDEVENWKGHYTKSSLTVSQNRLIAGANHYLKFVKEPSNEETLYCTLVPEAGRKPIFEFDVCCLGVNDKPIGLYLESIDNEEVSVSALFQTAPETQQIQMILGDQVRPYTSGDWQHLRWEMDLDAGRYNLKINGAPVIQGEALAAPVNNFDLISLKADPQTEGTLLLNNVKVIRGK